MSTPQIENSNITSYQALGLKDPGSAAPRPLRSASVDWAKLAGAKAEGLAENAAQLHGQIKQATALYNTQSESAIHDTVENYRTRFGEDLAQSTEASLRLLKSGARQSLEDARGALEAGFSLSGAPYAFDPTTDRYEAQPFTATAEVQGARMRYDSETGGAVAVGTGPFRRTASPAPQGLLDVTA
jgi:hypothetical protein